jgi:hypothetical protein
MKVTVCIAKDKRTTVNQRVRAGLWFTAEPTVVDVSSEQLAAIKADDFLEIVEQKAAPKAAPKAEDK